MNGTHMKNYHPHMRGVYPHSFLQGASRLFPKIHFSEEQTAHGFFSDRIS